MTTLEVHYPELLDRAITFFRLKWMGKTKRVEKAKTAAVLSY